MLAEEVVWQRATPFVVSARCFENFPEALSPLARNCRLKGGKGSLGSLQKLVEIVEKVAEEDPDTFETQGNRETEGVIVRVKLGGGEPGMVVRISLCDEEVRYPESLETALLGCQLPMRALVRKLCVNLKEEEIVDAKVMSDPKDSPNLLYLKTGKQTEEGKSNVFKISGEIVEPIKSSSSVLETCRECRARGSTLEDCASCSTPGYLW